MADLKLKLEKRKKHWYIVNVPKGWYNEGEASEYGPYKDKDEAKSDMLGLKRFAEQNPKYA